MNEDLSHHQICRIIFVDPKPFHMGYGFDPEFFSDFLKDAYSEEDAHRIWECLTSGSISGCGRQLQDFYSFYCNHIRTNVHCSGNRNLLRTMTPSEVMNAWMCFMTVMEREFLKLVSAIFR